MRTGVYFLNFGLLFWGGWVYNFGMKKIAILSLLCALPIVSYGAENPMFGRGAQNSLGLYVAQSTGDGTLFKLVEPWLWEFSPQTLFMFQYAQPMEIFRLPARINFELTQNVGYHGGHGLSFFAAGVSWDVALLQWRGFYTGVGVGPYMRDSRDRWVSSRLVFGERFFIGYRVADNMTVEYFTQHFSNGNFTDPNRGFNFTGLAFNYSF